MRPFGGGRCLIVRPGAGYKGLPDVINGGVDSVCSVERCEL